MTDLTGIKSTLEDSQPRWLYEIRQSLLVVYRITGGDRDITWNGYTWKAEQVASSEVGTSTNTNDFEVSLTLPIRHALCQRYLAQGSPPRQIVVTIYEYQPELDDAEQMWIGYITSMSADFASHVASFRIPSRLTRSLQRKVSSITSGPECPHVLYGPDCRADDSTRKVTTTITSVDGRRVSVADLGPYIGDAGVFELGDLLHVASGETMTIFTQFGDGREMDLQGPLPELAIGEVVTLRLGCDHTRNTCRDIFDNMDNYGGLPELPTSDLFIPGNKIGVYGS
jgi:uncharacterized protein